MIKFIAALGLLAISYCCYAGKPVLVSADPILDRILVTHYQAEFCKSPAVTSDDKAKLISDAMAVTTPDLVYDYSFTPMDYAILADDVPSLEHLVAVGYRLGIRAPFGQTLLHSAVWDGSANVVAFLLANGLDPNSTDNAGVTPIMLAASEGRFDLVKLLLRNGANINARSNDGRTPLSYSMICKNQVLVDLLLNAGASIDLHSKNLASRVGLVLRHER